MSNIKLTGHTWDTSGIYDAEQEKTQKQVNADVSEAITQYTGNAEIQFSDPSLKQYINTNTDPVQWDTPSTSVSTNIKWAVVPCNAGDRFTISGLGGNGDRLWAFVNSSKNRIAWADAYAMLDKVVVTAPTNSAYLIINSETDVKSYVGEYIAKQAEENKNTIFAAHQCVEITGSDSTWERKLILATGAVNNSVNNVLSGYIKVPSGSSVVFTGATVSSNKSNNVLKTAEYKAYIAEYSNNTTGFIKRTPLYVNSTDYFVPVKLTNTTEYIRIMYGHDNNTVTATLEADPYLFRCIVFPPENQGSSAQSEDEKILSRIKEFTSLSWKALSPVPTPTSGSTLSGNISGIPYSSVKEYDKYVGFNVMPITFLSAAKNPYSLLYTENVNVSDSTSEYGITYHGTNCGAYFGIVCNIFALHGLGLNIPWNTGEFNGAFKLGIFKQIADQSANGVKIGDLIWQTGHARIVTEIEQTANNGKVVHYAEAANPLPRLGSYTSETEFNSWLVTNNAIIYRCSPFTDFIEEDVFENYEYNPDVCTFAGDYASFYKGEEIWINYNLGETVYTGISVYKGPTLVSSDTLPSGHKISLGTSLDAGIYTAVLTGSTTSNPTHFEVVDTTTSVSIDGHILTVEFSSVNGEPEYVQLCYSNGTSRGIYPLSSEEKIAGKCVFDAVKLKNYFYTGAFSENVYAKVFFRGRYGVVRSFNLVGTL